MRVLIATDKFKGSLSAAEAAEAMARGVRRIWPDAEIALSPVADGGEGFADAMRVALNGEWRPVLVEDPLGREVPGRYAWESDSSLAIVEMAEASGLWRLGAGEHDPMRAHTRGTGQLMRHAIEHGAKQILVGLGGSATNDGGAGMAHALGYRFFDADDAPLEPSPEKLSRLARIDASGVPSDLPKVIAACDVRNPLLGERGASHVFGPQKGADEVTVQRLDATLAHVADIVTRDLGCDFRESSGAGAAGGLGYGLLTYARAEVKPGFDLVADTIALAERISHADLVLTGEGKLDSQTLDGKGPAGVALMAQKYGKPVVAFAGVLAPGNAHLQLFTAAFGIASENIPVPVAILRAAELLEERVAAALPGTHLREWHAHRP